LGFSKNEIKAIIADIVNENSDIDKVEDFIREGLRRA
jgi:Holliday junction resolvasome RuvABC DNA-binding subunit